MTDTEEVRLPMERGNSEVTDSDMGQVEAVIVQAYVWWKLLLR
jgi:hypothetical protein